MKGMERKPQLSLGGESASMSASLSQERRSTTSLRARSSSTSHRAVSAQLQLFERASSFQLGPQFRCTAVQRQILPVAPIEGEHFASHRDTFNGVGIYAVRRHLSERSGFIHPDITLAAP